MSSAVFCAATDLILDPPDVLEAHSMDNVVRVSSGC